MDNDKEEQNVSRIGTSYDVSKSLVAFGSNLHSITLTKIADVRNSSSNSREI